ncbi:MAG: DUF4251 domain-containing protein [Bacteroidales bacterium]|jgi:hypothetical protein|nr:DUF4251 domain-containing protein [Bacteroidales bacterium]MBQ5485869.1 DUF4251 domain-containing protein [Bacteroidales bacterium]MBQ6301614.1 DUF4251 domain-containing protein [Bacteroidales bacterium]MEE3476361.1 DUF4251 domain-containing protein [Candidatus Cryptobacteroides sp.]
MRKSLLTVLAAAALLLCGCSALRLTPEDKARIAAQVQENLDNRKYTIDVTEMHPLRGPSRQVTGFSLKIDGNKIFSCLPYFGVAYNVPYGGGKGLNFDAEISDYIDTTPKADRRQIMLATYNGEDHFVYTITVFANGRASIDVNSRNREPMSYYGEMITD